MRCRFHNDADHRHRVLRHVDIGRVAVLCQPSHHQSVGQDAEENREAGTTRSGRNRRQSQDQRKTYGRRADRHSATCGQNTADQEQTRFSSEEILIAAHHTC